MVRNIVIRLPWIMLWLRCDLSDNTSERTFHQEQLNFDSINALCTFCVIYFIRFANHGAVCFTCHLCNLVEQAAENQIRLCCCKLCVIFFCAIGPFAFSISASIENHFKNHIKHSSGILEYVTPFRQRIKLIVRVTHVL